MPHGTRRSSRRCVMPSRCSSSNEPDTSRTKARSALGAVVMPRFWRFRASASLPFWRLSFSSDIGLFIVLVVLRRAEADDEFKDVEDELKHPHVSSSGA